MSSNTIQVTIDFSGGAEFLVKAKTQKVNIPAGYLKWRKIQLSNILFVDSTLRDVLKFVRDNLVTDVHRIDMLLNYDSSEVAHGK